MKTRARVSSAGGWHGHLLFHDGLRLKLTVGAGFSWLIYGVIALFIAASGGVIGLFAGPFWAPGASSAAILQSGATGLAVGAAVGVALVAALKLWAMARSRTVTLASVTAEREHGAAGIMVHYGATVVDTDGASWFFMAQPHHAHIAKSLVAALPPSGAEEPPSWAANHTPGTPTALSFGTKITRHDRHHKNG